MDYCGPIGLPHSQFLTWTQDDQDKAVAWIIARNSKCPRCGTVPSDWLDEEGRDREPPPHSVKVMLCVGCQTLQDAVSEIPEDRRMFYHPHFVPWSEEEWDPNS